MNPGCQIYQFIVEMSEQELEEEYGQIIYEGNLTVVEDIDGAP